jgi:hypothetical protein
MPGDAANADPRRHAPATVRNRDAILGVLREELPERGLTLEIASGSGEHVVYFAQHMPWLDWQPSDPDPVGMASIDAYCTDAASPNLRRPVALDASAQQWPVDRADAILCINMVHISPWAATQGLFGGAARRLAAGAPLILYGPFIEADVPTAPSNIDFDQSLKSRDPAWGLRDLAALDALAAHHGLVRTRRVSMPANNLMLVWRAPDNVPATG